MRKPAEQFQRQAALQGRFLNPRPQRLPPQPQQPAQRVGDRIGGGKARVDAFPRILEHHLDMRPIGVTGENAGGHIGQFAPVEPDFAIRNVQLLDVPLANED